MDASKKLAEILNDNTSDTTPDEMQFIQQGIDGNWRYMDCNHEECCYPRRDLAIAFVTGKFHSMRLANPETNLICGVYDKSGNLLDTITTK